MPASGQSGTSAELSICISTQNSLAARTCGNSASPNLEECNSWMSAVTRGDREAFAKLFKLFAPRVKGSLVRSGTENSLADELAQETMICLWRRGGSFDPARGTLSTWIFTIARNLRTDQHRRSAARGAGGFVFVNLELWEADLGVADVRPPLDDALLGLQRERALRGALAKLAAEQALLLQLSFFEERSHATIARELGIPLGTVKTRIRSAVAHLRRLLQDE
jgi:RNA polymerase sigma-70 factor (ECF subfamily)